jgi:hypothetical protein
MYSSKSYSAVYCSAQYYTDLAIIQVTMMLDATESQNSWLDVGTSHVFRAKLTLVLAAATA